MTEQNEVKDVIDAPTRIRIAIESLIPDPTQTIGDYQKGQRRKSFWLWYSAVISTLALVVVIVQLIMKVH